MRALMTNIKELMTVIAVVDYDMGNLHSVCKGWRKLTPKITDSQLN